jgi:hypothetical protein
VDFSRVVHADVPFYTRRGRHRRLLRRQKEEAIGNEHLLGGHLYVHNWHSTRSAADGVFKLASGFSYCTPHSVAHFRLAAVLTFALTSTSKVKFLLDLYLPTLPAHCSARCTLDPPFSLSYLESHHSSHTTAIVPGTTISLHESPALSLDVPKLPTPTLSSCNHPFHAALMPRPRFHICVFRRGCTRSANAIPAPMSALYHKSQTNPASGIRVSHTTQLRPSFMGPSIFRLYAPHVSRRETTWSKAYRCVRSCDESQGLLKRRDQWSGWFSSLENESQPTVAISNFSQTTSCSLSAKACPKYQPAVTRLPSSS